MNTTPIVDVATLLAEIQAQIDGGNLVTVSETIETASVEQLTEILERLPLKQRAVAYRLLPKDLAIDVFERLSPGLQSDLIRGLQDSEVAAIFADLDPDDRVWLIDELPAALAPKLLHGLSEKERALTAGVLGYPKGSAGRRMTPEYVSTRVDATVGEAMQRVQARLDEAETIYTLPVLDDNRHVVGVVSLRDLMRATEETSVADIVQPAKVVTAYQDAESAARICTGARYLAVPVVDKENRLVGMLTIDDAVKILEFEDAEDTARQGGVEPLRRPYLATPIRVLVSSRIVWLLVLAIGATLTVQVLSVFEDTLEQVTVLALFVPLLIGTGGNTGNQAATTVTRALALGDVKPRDLGRVLFRELGVGVMLGTLLGIAGGMLTGLVYEPRIGFVIGFTLIAVCAMAAAIGGIMPIIARSLRVDPAVFSNPFITTFVDASGLIVYFLIAQAILQIG
ncbi:magnesium transporter [Gulosibacter chungangensis]|uniref:Magnesium transporter MgtE n=1 Tax=Gulosibacter chungangensis TaxID=979746 RepID=A0A7J5BHN1_9MICO|nr:magnesium transporter [Gulosibacter chungangensis]KAB1644929.1 magnesium transporter [Gulosibacter chungangensis]